MNLTSEQIERLRVRFEAWWKPQVTEENFGGFSKYDEQRAWQGYLALASAMLSEESVERAAGARHPGLFSDNPETAHMVASPTAVEFARANAMSEARATICAALFGGAG
jgi:hypothetical protein